MKGARPLITACIGLYLAAALQQAMSPRMSIFGIMPDFPLVFVAIFALFASRPAATVTGFFAGAAEGALAGVNLTHYIVSRTLAGFFGGASAGLGVQPNMAVAGIVAAVLTALSQMLLFFLAPPGGIGRFLGDTIGAAMYNGVLAMPMYALLRKILAAPGS